MQNHTKIRIEHFIEIVKRYQIKEWCFGSLGKPVENVQIADNGATLDYPRGDKYRPICFGSTLSSIGAQRVKIDFHFVRNSNISSFAFWEDSEQSPIRTVPLWFEHGLFTHVADNLLPDTPIVRYKGQHFHWRGNRAHSELAFNEDNDVVRIVLDLPSGTATITNLKNMEISSVLEGITGNTRLVIIPLSAKITVQSCIFAFGRTC